VPSTLQPQLSAIGPYLDARPETFWARFAPLLALGILWADLVRQLSYQWSTNEQYAYGWFVPLLSIGLLWRKCTATSRPAIPDPQTLRAPTWMLLLVGIVVFAFFPIRIVHEINQDWPLFSWPLAIAVVVMSLYSVFLMGGWQWVGYLAFPVCFILVAVKWPYQFEHTLTHGLMRAVAGLTVSILGCLDVVAFQHGNLIELSSGTIGIDEACSGIRSLQSTLMGSLFLSELYLLGWWWRAMLIGSGVLLAFCFNVVRALVLTWQASCQGIAAVEKWHDTFGLTVFLACFAALWLLAWFLKSKTSTGTAPDSPAVRSPVVGSPVVHSPVVSSFPRLFTYAVSGWVAFIILGNEIWYRSHDTSSAQSVRWWLNSPTNLPSFQQVSVPESARKLLKYDQGAASSWEEKDGVKWFAYCFRWRAGDPTARMSALGHRPEYCLTGSGHELDADLGTKYFQANGMDFPFRAYVFDQSQRPLHVFFCLWEDGAEKQVGFGKSKYLDRLRSVISGRRGLGQQTFEIVVSGYPTIERAEQAVRQRFPGLVQMEAATTAQTHLNRAGS
jgi:exosortase